jgi:hypothetical protein
MDQQHARILDVIEELLAVLNAKLAPHGAFVFLWDGEVIPAYMPAPDAGSGFIN